MMKNYKMQILKINTLITEEGETVIQFAFDKVLLSKQTE